MPRTLDDYRRKLIQKILLSSSTTEVRRFVNTAVRSLLDHKVHGYIILRFINRTISELETFVPPGNDVQQTGNLRAAIDQFLQFRRQFEGTPVA